MAVICRLPQGGYGGGVDEQLINYTMIYDAGNECVDITNSWDRSCGNTSINTGNFGQLTKNSDSFSGSINDTSATANYLYYRCTTNAIDLTEYSMLGSVCRNLVASGTYGLEVCWWDESPVFWSGTRNPSSSVGDGKVEILGVDGVVGNKYITVSIATSYDKTASITADISGVFMVKADNWQAWIDKAGLSISDYASLDEVMADTEALSTLMNDAKAVSYMLLNCTGTVMASVIQSANALSAIRDSQCNAGIYANVHWDKFLRMVGEVPESEKGYLYDNGVELVTLNKLTSYPYNGSTRPVGTVTKNSDNIYFKASNTTSAWTSDQHSKVATATKIDLSDYKYIKANASNNIFVFVMSSLSDFYNNTVASSYAPELDISNVTGEHYVVVGLSSGINTTIETNLYQLWLE